MLRNRNRRQHIAHIVFTRKRDLHLPQELSSPNDSEFQPSTGHRHSPRLPQGLRGKAKGLHRTESAGTHSADGFIIGTAHQQTAARDQIDKAAKGHNDFVQVAVDVSVIIFNIVDHTYIGHVA